MENITIDPIDQEFINPVDPEKALVTLSNEEWLPVLVAVKQNLEAQYNFSIERAQAALDKPTNTIELLLSLKMYTVRFWPAEIFLQTTLDELALFRTGILKTYKLNLEELPALSITFDFVDNVVLRTKVGRSPKKGTRVVAKKPKTFGKNK